MSSKEVSTISVPLRISVTAKKIPILFAVDKIEVAHDIRATLHIKTENTFGLVAICADAKIASELVEMFNSAGRRISAVSDKALQDAHPKRIRISDVASAGIVSLDWKSSEGFSVAQSIVVILREPENYDPENHDHGPDVCNVTVIGSGYQKSGSKDDKKRQRQEPDESSSEEETEQVEVKTVILGRGGRGGKRGGRGGRR